MASSLVDEMPPQQKLHELASEAHKAIEEHLLGLLMARCKAHSDFVTDQLCEANKRLFNEYFDEIRKVEKSCLEARREMRRHQKISAWYMLVTATLIVVWWMFQ
jgi:hypothetical protein